MTFGVVSLPELSSVSYHIHSMVVVVSSVDTSIPFVFFTKRHLVSLRIGVAAQLKVCQIIGDCLLLQLSIDFGEGQTLLCITRAVTVLVLKALYV